MSVFRKIFETLRDHYERRPQQAWWPEDPIEVVVGAVLVQGSTWKSVAKVLDNLRSSDLLDFAKIRNTDAAELEVLIRSVGFQSKKAKRLKEIASLLLDRCGGDLERFFARDPDTVRRELLTVQGIGPGTADNIMLYAGKIPMYMVDPFTTRVLVRHGIIGEKAREPEIQQLIHQELTPDEEPYGAKLFGDFQAYMVWLGRDYCDKSAPACGVCPLYDFLPPGGAVGVGDKALAVVSARQSHSRATPEPVVVAPKKVDEPVRAVEEISLSDTERNVFDQLGETPISIDLLIAHSGLPAHVVRATIAMLEMRRILKQVEGNRVAKTV